jgi:hypothetical protein
MDAFLGPPPRERSERGGARGGEGKGAEPLVRGVRFHRKLDYNRWDVQTEGIGGTIAEPSS